MNILPKIKPVKLLSEDPARNCDKTDKTYERNGFHVSISCGKGTNGTNHVEINIYLHRDIKKYLFQYYLPSAIIVFVSQTSFVIPLSAIPGRISLVVTQFLALTNIFINEQVIIIR